MRIKKIDKTNHENNRSSWKSPFSNLWLLLCFNFSRPLQISNPCLRVSFTREKLAWGQCYVAEQWVLKWTVINAIQLFQSLFNLILHCLSRVGLDSWILMIRPLFYFIFFSECASNDTWFPKLSHQPPLFNLFYYFFNYSY